MNVPCLEQPADSVLAKVSAMQLVLGFTKVCSARTYGAAFRNETRKAWMIWPTSKHVASLERAQPDSPACAAALVTRNPETACVRVVSPCVWRSGCKHDGPASIQQFDVSDIASVSTGRDAPQFKWAWGCVLLIVWQSTQCVESHTVAAGVKQELCKCQLETVLACAVHERSNLTPAGSSDSQRKKR